MTSQPELNKIINFAAASAALEAVAASAMASGQSVHPWSTD